MESEIKIGKKVFIRNAGKDEYWLQDIIYQDPKILGLGDLIAMNKEKKQSTGGRLDLLLKDVQDNTMYEVEIMLGETDPSHIIRAIEYWDLEKRKYPQRQHFSVLVAESFDRRYFNVIQLMSLDIPMIAIQADLIELKEGKVLNFTKILDIYTEPEEDESDLKVVNEQTWNNNASWTLSASKFLYNQLKEQTDKTYLRFTQSYISISIEGKNFYWLCKRISPTSALFFSVKDDEKVEAIKNLLEQSKIEYTFNRYKEFMLLVDEDSIKKHIKLLLTIHNLRCNKAQIDEFSEAN